MLSGELFVSQLEFLQMPDVVTSIFRLENDRGFFVPKFDIKYIEKDTDIQWIINCGGTRAYFIRIGNELWEDFDAECADSHFMVNRVVTSLFMGGVGLFRAKATGRIFFKDIGTEELRFTSHVDLRSFEKENNKAEIERVSDWYKFICLNNLFRRAADDAYSAVLNPVEATFYIYRGMEWLMKAGNIGWRELAEDIGVTFKQIKEFKRTANVELGQRHGIESARKERAQTPEYGSLVADFVYGICKVRKRVDSSYEVPSPKDVSDIVIKALPIVPYP